MSKEKEKTEKKSYRSAKLTPANKARWVNRWMAFHRAFPDVSIGEWCGLNNLSAGTFQNWLRDPKCNKEIRIKHGLSETLGHGKKKKAAKAGNEPEDLFSQIASEEEAIASSVPEPEPEKKTETVKNEPAAEIPPYAEEHESGEVVWQGPFVTFTCADFRVEVTKQIPIQDINRIIGYASAMMYRMPTRESKLRETIG